ncbi:MAG: DEAD/DEAH box helicase [Sandaracinaceae bacterium]
MSDLEQNTTTFDDLGLAPDVRRAIDEMGFASPTPVQAATYTPAVEGKDLVVQARTGTGKTAAFGIPIVDRLVRTEGGVQALILAPTRELALQSSRELSRLGVHRKVRTAAVYGGAPMDKQIRELSGGAHVVSGTPGRVLDHLKRRTLRTDDLRILVLDEADEMLSMGFAKELNAIVELLPTRRQTMLFSATIDDAVERMSRRILKEPERISLSSDAVGARGITHYYYLVSGLARTGDLVRILDNEDPETALIFCNTRAVTEQVARELQQAGFEADWLNGDLAQSEREKVLARTRKGELRYLVATDVAARGIDISHVTHVINFDFPAHVESYVHRTGRTGRAGRTGTAISLVAPPELGALYYLRLQYKIFPIERSLPTVGELQTRREADRIALLAEALPESLSEMDRAVARRLLAHPDAERLVGGLLATFFGTSADEELDEEAAAARRERPAPPAPEPEPSGGAARAPRDVEPADGEDLAEAEDVDDEDVAYLYVNIGRRDGVRPGDIIGLLADECDLDKDEVGKIRIRDRHTFVGVPPDRADSIVEQLSGLESHGKELVVEPARGQP